jgi:hypothetical protein
LNAIPSSTSPKPVSRTVRVRPPSGSWYRPVPMVSGRPPATVLRAAGAAGQAPSARVRAMA